MPELPSGGPERWKASTSKAKSLNDAPSSVENCIVLGEATVITSSSLMIAVEPKSSCSRIQLPVLPGTNSSRIGLPAAALVAWSSGKSGRQPHATSSAMVPHSCAAASLRSRDLYVVKLKYPNPILERAGRYANVTGNEGRVGHREEWHAIDF